MASGNLKEALIFFGIASIVGCIVYFKPEPGDIGLWVLNALLALAAAALIAHVVGSYWQRIAPRIAPRSNTRQTVPAPATLSEDELRERVAKAREEKQRENTEKATEYYENVTKPKEEAKLREKEEKFYKQNMQEWKLTSGEKVGWDEGENVPENDTSPNSSGEPSAPGAAQPNDSPKPSSKGPRSYFKGSGKEAAGSRRLPDHVMNPPPPPPQPKKKEKRKVVMPEEPTEGTQGAITVTLRTPQGLNHRRRFLTSQTIQELLDFMTIVGFAQSGYQVCTSYPRCCISSDVTKTFMDWDITHDTALNVEHKE